MNRRKLRSLISVLMIALAPAFPAAAEAPYGAAGMEAGEEYGLPEMLAFAIADEYPARAEYEAILSAFGMDRPFSDIIRAEEKHIARLSALFAAQGLEVPPDAAREHVALPGSPEEVYRAGIAAEEANIAMYKAFLETDGLPGDARRAFRALMRASENHLRAFERFARDTGNGRGRRR